ncbi:MAG: serine hydrolase [Rhizomicrobium sp.]
MKHVGTAGLVGLFLAATVPAHAALLPDRVAKAAEQRIAQGWYHTLVFAVTDGGKSDVVTFGKLEDGKAPDGNSVYEIGSITKTFTATLLAQDILSGGVSLDTPIAMLLPGFTMPARDGKQITLGEIGTQHSGLPRLPANFQPVNPANPYADYDAAKLKAFLAGYALPRDPGASYEYSNLGFGLLGFALAQSHHETYADLVGQIILSPLGMTSSSVAAGGAVPAHLAPGHDASGNRAGNWDFDALAGCGAIRSTGNDMLRYLNANIGRGPLSAAMKFAQEPRADMAPGTRIGLAWMTTDKGIVWHNGGTGGYRSFIGFTADGSKGVVVLGDSVTQVDDLGFAALDASAPLVALQQPAEVPAAALDAYVGTYKLADKFLLKIFRIDDALYAQATGQGAFQIFPQTHDEFVAKIAPIGISFKRDAAGDVAGLVLHQNGDRTAPKLTAAELPPPPKEIKLDPAALQAYVGKYQLGGAKLDVTLSGDQLSAQLAGQSPFPIYPSAKDRFFYKIVDAQLDFERDAAGKVVAVTLHQNGRDMRAALIAN